MKSFTHPRSAGFEGEPRSRQEWQAGIKNLLADNQYFLAYDLARTGMELFPDDIPLKQLAARALLQTGGVDAAMDLLEPLCPNEVDEGRLQPPDEESLGLLGRVYKEMWQRTGAPENAKRSRDAYLCAFRATGGYWTGINAAAMSLLMGDRQQAEDLAAEILTACETMDDDADDEEQYWRLATRGEACVILSKGAKALEAYQQAAAIEGHKPYQITSSLAQLNLFREGGIDVPEELTEILKPPVVVIFVGHMIDEQDRKERRFPPGKEAAVREAIDRQLADMEADISYSSAACGADIIFLEAMQDRGGEINVILPFDADDFIRTSVSLGRADWTQRFQKILRTADSVKYVTDEHFLGSALLFRFCAQIFCGYANLRSQILGTDPHLLAVWDGMDNGKEGGTADIVSRWHDPGALHVIDLRALPEKKIEPAAVMAEDGLKDMEKVETTASLDGKTRVIKTMLFADLKGYSKLENRNIPFYAFEFLNRVALALKEAEGTPEHVNTWGDAIFAVMSEALPLAEYALRLRNIVCDTDWSEMGLPAEMNVRIGLHAGPVFEGTDPIVGRPGFFGTHINRAARIEPVTVPGSIYASEQFAAMLTAEQAREQYKAREKGQAYQSRYATDYVGVIDLAKQYGKQVVYCIRETGGQGDAARSESGGGEKD